MACHPTIFDGMSREDMQAQLTALQQVYLALSAGQSVITATYMQGDGNKSVTYKRADLATVTATILQLQQLLGLRARARRPMRFRYS